MTLLGAVGYSNWVAWSEALDTSIVPVPVSPADQAATAPSQSSFKAAVLDDYKETVERPLFQSDRRPPKPEPVKDESAALAAAETSVDKNANTGLRFLGMMRPVGQAPRALVQLDGAANAEWVAEGSAAGDWKMIEIRDDNIVVVNAGARRSFALHGDRSAKNKSE